MSRHELAALGNQEPVLDLLARCERPSYRSAPCLAAYGRPKPSAMFEPIESTAPHDLIYHPALLLWRKVAVISWSLRVRE
jgi:hypothetical protein